MNAPNLIVTSEGYFVRLKDYRSLEMELEVERAACVLCEKLRREEQRSFIAERNTLHNKLASPVGLRQYYYRSTECRAPSAQAPDCVCWHDEGTGPLADPTYSQPKEWRTKPNETA